MKNTLKLTADGFRSFSAEDLTHIKTIWANVAQAYAPFDINVTTVGPATAGLSDAARQTFYDAKPNMIHTVLGSQNRGGVEWWNGDNTGIAALGGATGSVTDPDLHTNGIFTASNAYGSDANTAACISSPSVRPTKSATRWA